MNKIDLKDILQENLADDNQDYLSILGDEKEMLNDHTDIPDTLPILPLRNTVLFPGVIIPINIGREKSLKLIRYVYKSSVPFGVIAQRDTNTENPKLEDLYTIGTVATVLKILEMPDGTTTAIIQGKKRFELDDILYDEPYHVGKIIVKQEDTITEEDQEYNAIGEALKDMALKIVKYSSNIPNEAGFALKNIESMLFLINFISSNTDIDYRNKQELLEIDILKERATKLLELLGKQVKILELKEDILLIFSENGLYCCNTRFNDYSELRFYHQTHDKTDTTSLPQNNILAVTQSHNGEVILSCGGQLCEIVGKNYLQEKIPFRKIDTPQFPASVAALCSDNKGLVWGVTNRSVFSYDPIKKIINHYPPSSPKEVRHFSVNPFFILNDSCIMKGCREGWIQFDPRKVAKRSNLAPVYISEVKTLKTQNSIIVDTDSIISLRPEEREFSVRFSVLDYNRTSPVWYAYRMIGEDMKWSLTEQNETAPYVDLPAGKYTFAVRSTNGDGRWLDNERKLIIEIQPYWYEKTSIRWCMAILFLLSIAGGWWLIDRYAQKQTLKAMEKLRALQQEVSAPDVIPTSDTNQSSSSPETTDKNDAFSRKLLAYLDAHIGDTDLKVEDLALHLGMSRKQLLQKMKTLFNCTPIDFIIANRITRSLQYMQSNNEMNIAEIAYCSGFNDPRYFSRCFKKHTGKSPSEYLSEVKRKATKAQT